MNTVNIPIFSHPIRACFLDDNSNFLKTIKLDLSSYGDILTYTSCKQAKKEIDSCGNHPSSEILNQIDQDESDLADSHLLCVKYRELYKIAFSKDRFTYPAVLIVDYKMPEKNGIDFCRDLNNKNIMKIMLTSEADHNLAVDAFNEGIIDQFLLKGSDSLNQKIVSCIEKLKTQFFQKISKTIFDTLPKHTQTLLSDPDFQKVFNSVKSDSKALEYYLIDNDGSFLFLDGLGSPTWLIVKNSSSLKDQYDMADAVEVDKNTLLALKNKEGLLFMFSIEDQRKPASDWHKYLHEIKPLGNEKFYAVIKGKTENQIKWADLVLNKNS